MSVKYQFEVSVASHLRDNGLESAVPLYRARRKWSDRIKTIDVPLFPGYVFCEFDPNDRRRVDMVPGVTGIVGFGSKLAEVDRGEIESIRTALAAGLPAAPWPRLELGRKVEIDFGPLRGVQGIVVKDAVQHTSAKHGEEFRLILSVSLLNRSLSIEINRDWVRQT